MQAFQLWLCILGLLCMSLPAMARVVRDEGSVAAHTQAEAEAATYLAKENGDAVAHASDIHPFRVALKHVRAQEQDKAEREQTQDGEAGAGGGAAVASDKAAQGDLMRYFERAQTQSKNAARRQQQMKINNGAQKRLARQEQAQQNDGNSEVVTPIPVTAVEESAKKKTLPSHPHLLAFYLSQLAEEAEDQAQQVDLGLSSPHDMALVEETQTASTGGAAAATTASATTTTAAAAAAGTTAPAAATTTANAAATTASAAAATTAVAAATTTAAAAAAAGATGAAATTTVAAAATNTGAVTATGGVTGGAAAAAESTGANAVTDSVVPLAHLQQLQSALSAVEAEHAARQAQLNAEVAKQQAQTKALLQQEQDGTVGLTVSPTLIDPTGYVPIDPNNAVLYNAAPTDPKMSIKPSVFTKADNLEASAASQHLEFVHNMPIECAEPTCSVGQ